MANHNIQITLCIAGIESEHKVIIAYDYAQEVREGKLIKQEVEIYDAYITFPGKWEPYIYVYTLLSDDQLNAIEEEIRRSHAEI